MSTNADIPQDEPRSEYDLEPLLEDGQRGRYAESYASRSSLVPLDPDVARTFPTPESVHDALRLMMRLAQQDGVTVAAWLAAAEERVYAAAQERALARLEAGVDLGTGGQIEVSRDELHER